MIEESGELQVELRSQSRSCPPRKPSASFVARPVLNGEARKTVMLLGGLMPAVERTGAQDALLLRLRHIIVDEDGRRIEPGEATTLRFSSLTS